MKHYKSFWHQFNGYYLIPHELLHVLAHRLSGQPCEYKWRDDHVKSLTKLTRWQELFVLLFPFAVCLGLGIFFHLLWISSAFFIDIPPERYFSDGPTWHFIFPNIASLFILYSGTSHWDLLAAYYLLFRAEFSE